MQIKNIFEIPSLVGQEFQGQPILVDQERINLFAEATGDYNAAHLDPIAAKTSIFRGVVAHGFLTVSLMGHMSSIWNIVSIEAPYELIANGVEVLFLRACSVDTKICFSFILLEATQVSVKEKPSIKTTWQVVCIGNKKELLKATWVITYVSK